MASEADLDTEVKGLSILSEHPELYEEFAKMGCVGSLISLLSHENADIAIDAIQIISELTDEDVEAEQEQWDKLVNAMVSGRASISRALYLQIQMDADLIELLTQNLGRLDESSETDRAGVIYVLGEFVGKNALCQMLTRYRCPGESLLANSACREDWAR
jgi:beta-catenin-like protein 1